MTNVLHHIDTDDLICRTNHWTHFNIRELLFVSDSLRDWVLFLQFKKREKHPWGSGSVTFSKLQT